MEIERRKRRVVSDQITLTSLIDVLFLLIVFFMLSTSFIMSEAIELTLPSASSGEAKPAGGSAIGLLVREDGSVSAGKYVYDANTLDRVVRELLKRKADQAFLLMAAPGASVQQMITAMDILYVNGARNVQMDHLYEGQSPDFGHDVQVQGARE